MDEIIDDTPYDIFEWFPIGVCQDIFKFFDGNAVIQASKVNKEWNKLCNESNQARKLKLVFQDDALSQICDAVSILCKSQRKYENVEFRGISSSETSCLLPLLAERAGSWKSMKFTSCTVGRRVLWEILRIIEPSVEQFVCDNSEVVDTDWVDEQLRFDYSNFTFQRLKVLKVDDASTDILECFVRCTTITKLDCSTSEEFESIDALSTIIRNNHNLKELALATDEEIFEISEFMFKLDKLQIKGEMAPEVLQAFLVTQASSLQTLEYLEKINREELELILGGMPRLSTFSADFDGIKEEIWAGARPLPVNSTITSLTLEGCIGDQSQDAFVALIGALPCLKHLKCHNVNESFFPFLARQFPALKSLKINHFNVSRLPYGGNIFRKLKKFKANLFDTNLPKPTGDSNFTALLKEEMGENPTFYRKRRYESSDSSSSSDASDSSNLSFQEAFVDLHS